MPSKFNDKRARGRVLPGFPIEEKFLTPESLAEYFGGATIVCLQCGKRYRTLGVHLKTIHGMEPDEYREIYGIPWTYGLSCAETSALHADDAKEKIAAGIFEPGKYLERAVAAPNRKRQPVRDVLSAMNIKKMNEGKTGEDAERRRLAPKRGTPEHSEVMRNRPQMQAAKELLRTYWKGREQTDEHVFKRTGHHKKAP
jgi:hypothetical protein